MNEEYLEAGKATEYLAKRWGIESYSTSAFKMLRVRWKIEPAFRSSNGTFWKKSDLDNIPKPDRSRPRVRKAKSTEEDDDGESKGAGGSVVFKSSLDWSLYGSETAPDLDLRRLPVGAC